MPHSCTFHLFLGSERENHRDLDSFGASSLDRQSMENRWESLQVEVVIVTALVTSCWLAHLESRKLCVCIAEGFN